MNTIVNNVTQSVFSFVNSIVPTISPQTKKIALIVTAALSFLTAACLICRCQLRGKVKKTEKVERPLVDAPKVETKKDEPVLEDKSNPETPKVKKEEESKSEEKTVQFPLSFPDFRRLLNPAPISIEDKLAQQYLEQAKLQALAAQKPLLLLKDKPENEEVKA